MWSFITLCCLFISVIPASFLNIIAYPVSRRWSCAISNYIVKVLAPRVFSILSCYRHYHFFLYEHSKLNLPNQFIVISNHQSLFDIPAFMCFFHEKDIRFVAKDNLSRHIPLVSEMLRAHEHCMIPRKGQMMRAMEVIGDFGRRVLSLGQVPILFPEGTRSKTGNVGKFHSAGFRKLNETTRLPIALCALDGGYQIRDVWHLMHNLKNGTYRIKVLRVYDSPETREEEEKILTESKELIQEQLDKWRLLNNDEK